MAESIVTPHALNGQKSNLFNKLIEWLSGPSKCPNCDELTDGFPCEHCGYSGGFE